MLAGSMGCKETPADPHASLGLPVSLTHPAGGAFQRWLQNEQEQTCVQSWGCHPRQPLGKSQEQPVKWSQW